MNSLLTTAELVKYLSSKDIMTTVSKEPIKEFKNVEQNLINGYNIAGRPNGIWYAHNGDWLKYIIEHNMKKTFTDCCYLYQIEPNYKCILKINTKTKLKSLKFYYHNAHNFIGLLESIGLRGFPLSKYETLNKIKTDYKTLLKERLIFDNPEDLKNSIIDVYGGRKIPLSLINEFALPRWDLIAKKFCGVEFIPYFTGYAKKNFWYDSLSIPSGCIWNRTGIKNYKLIAKKIKDKWKLTNKV